METLSSRSRLFGGISGSLVVLFGVVSWAADETVTGDLTLQTGRPELIFEDNDGNDGTIYQDRRMGRLVRHPGFS